MPRARKPAAKPEPPTIASYAFQEGRANLPTADNAASLLAPDREAPAALLEQHTPPPSSL